MQTRQEELGWHRPVHPRPPPELAVLVSYYRHGPTPTHTGGPRPDRWHSEHESFPTIRAANSFLGELLHSPGVKLVDVATEVTAATEAGGISVTRSLLGKDVHGLIPEQRGLTESS